MKRTKKSFTMAEIMITLTIIGIVLAVSVPAISRSTKSYTALTYYAFKNMQTMVKSMFEVSDEMPITYNGTEYTGKDFYVPSCKIGASPTDIWGAPGMLKPDVDAEIVGTHNCFENFATENGFNFCNRIAAMANTTGAVRCSTGGLFSVVTTDNIPYISQDEIDRKEPNFTTTNGQRYYISNRVVDDTHVSPDFGFRLVAVDLNGSRGPNIISPKSGQLYGKQIGREVPDIVTFMIMDNGYIYPLGVAADNLHVNGGGTINYLNSRLKLYQYGGAAAGGNAGSTCQTTNEADDAAGDTATRQDCQGTINYIDNPESYRNKFCRSGDRGREFYPAYCQSDGTSYSATDIASRSECQGTNECYVEPIKPLMQFK